MATNRVDIVESHRKPAGDGRLVDLDDAETEAHPVNVVVGMVVAKGDNPCVRGYGLSMGDALSDVDEFTAIHITFRAYEGEPVEVCTVPFSDRAL